MSEMSIQEACDLTEHFGKFLKGMARLQEAAATLRGAEPVIAQRMAASESLRADNAAAATRLESLKSECEAAVLAAAGTISHAQAEAAQILAGARAEAERVATAAAQELAASDALLNQRKADIAGLDAQVAAASELLLKRQTEFDELLARARAIGK